MPCEKQELQILRKLNHFARVYLPYHMDNPACHQRVFRKPPGRGFNTATKLGVLKIINQVKSDETGPQSPVNVD